jgi:hypothetical protein
MAKKFYFPRLTKRDCERLLDVHQQLNRVRDTLERANWAGGPACSSGIMSALVLVSDLYNRAEHAFLRGGDLPPEPSFEAGQAELPAAELEAPPADQKPIDKSEG